MSELLTGNNAASRLFEVLGSTALLTDPTTQATDLSSPLNVLGSDNPSDMSTDQPASGVTEALAPVLALAPIDSVLSNPQSDSNLPIVGNLPIIGDTHINNDLPIIGDLLHLGSGGDGGSALTLAGPDGILQAPLLDPANTLILDVHTELEILAHETGTIDIVHGVTNLGETIGLGQIGTVDYSDGHTNLVTDVLNAPGAILDGNLTDTAAHLGADLSDTINAISALKDAVIFDNGSTNPIPAIISNLGNDLQHLPLLTINGGNNANDGGLIGGVVGSLDNPSSGHLVDADVGPQQNNGLVFNLLSQPDSGPQHTAEVNAVDVGPNGPHLADIGLLTGADGLHIPSLNGAGSDGLIGSLPIGNVAAAGNTGAPTAAPIDISAIHDLVSAPLATDHGILDLHGSHII